MQCAPVILLSQNLASTFLSILVIAQAIFTDVHYQQVLCIDIQQQTLSTPRVVPLEVLLLRREKRISLDGQYEYKSNGLPPR